MSPLGTPPGAPATQNWKPYWAVTLQRGQALVKKANTVCVLMKLRLVEMMGIEEIVADVPSLSKEMYTHDQSGEQAKASLGRLVEAEP